MKKDIKYTLLTILLLVFAGFTNKGLAQDVIQGIVTDTKKAPLIGVTISETDASNRVVNGTITDINGNYVLKMNNPNNTLEFIYLGMKKITTKPGNRKVINIAMEEDSKEIKEVVVTAVRKTSQGGYSIPTREVGTALQKLDMKAIEGIQVTSIEDALQGRIAGLDVVANSSDPGKAASMRIRGVTSITGNSEPLVVLNNVPYSINIDPNFDFANSNQEQYANMLSINPDDILEITVLKDAASSAIWGSRGANGVIMITTKRGVSGPTRVDYTYRYTGTRQPKGINMLSGNDFTMLMKQAYLNPQQNDYALNGVEEYNYNPNFPYYEDFNNNTDWVKEVTQFGNIHDHYLTISGGGERATYRVSGGFLTQNGTIIGQNFKQVSTRSNFDYSVSDRIRFSSEIALTYTDNFRTYESNNGDIGIDNILSIAYRKMPNVSVYAQDAQGNNTDTYFNIPRTSLLNDAQKNLPNPVALARLAENRMQSSRIRPVFGLTYDLVDPSEQTLRLNMNVSFDINNDKTTMFLPAAASNLTWSDKKVNRADNLDAEWLNVFNETSLDWIPKMKNKDHSVILYGASQITYGNSLNQGITTYSLPSGELIDASNPGYTSGANNSRSAWRGIAFLARGHYAYKGRYIADGTFREEGSTKFGPANRWGTFPGASLKWIISDEDFLKPAKKWLSMLAIRPSWGISGNQPGADYLHFSRYASDGNYMDMPAIKPSTMRINNLKWESSTQLNYGLDLGLLDDRLYFDFNYYTKRTKDLLFRDVAMPATSGYDKISYINGGIMDNEGWEINFNGRDLIKINDFHLDFFLNLSNYQNTIIQLDKSLLDSYNNDFDYKNGSYLTRIQPGNSFGSIYGFRYKGVYKYDSYAAAIANEGSLLDKNGKPYAPYATDAGGNVILDQNGNPKPMYYAYNILANRTQFRGGDAIYEDVNHDGSIDEQDIVYLGNCNPKLNGGFGPTFRYKDFSWKLFFNFRYGNKIVNTARMNAENMYTDNNQSIAVNWRWRKDGDVTDMPRALYNYGYNWLGSDRYVEDGSFLRLKYMTFTYAVPSQFVKKYRMNRVSLYLTINNLFVWTKYTGVDPEVGYGVLTANKGLSIDNSATPRTKDFTLGISIGL